MQWLCYVLATTLLRCTFWDAFVTVFSSRGGGPLTNLWTQSIWRGLLAVHHRKPMHRLLAFGGPLMMLSVVLVWYVLLTAGWALFFTAQADSVVDNLSGSTTGFLEKVYFAGTTVSAVGYGDLVPAGFPWTLWSNAAALSGTVLLTTSLSYFLPVVTASTERKSLAEGVFAIGKSVPDFIGRAWPTGSQGGLDSYLLQLISAMDMHAHKHLAYPVLHFFHSSEADKSPSRAMLLFSDALFVISRCVAPQHRPPEGVLQVANSCIENYSNLTYQGKIPSDRVNRADSDGPTEESIRQRGLPLVDSVVLAREISIYTSRRKRLVALCYSDGWCATKTDAAWPETL